MSRGTPDDKGLIDKMICDLTRDSSDDAVDAVMTAIADAGGTVAGSHNELLDALKAKTGRPKDLLKKWLKRALKAAKQNKSHTEEEQFILPISGGFIVPLGQLQAALRVMNERWCVVKIGAKTRYMNLRHDGVPEFLDKHNFVNLFENAFYEYRKADRVELGKFAYQWLNWVGRRQYRGYGFFPAPDGHQDACPEGYYNAYRGFSVEPKMGSWKLLLGHLYRNVCRRDKEHFRWLFAWLAQLVQQPHIKPGTHVVLKGAEGTGKSKLGEWIIRLFAPNAMPLTSNDRVTGRFNVHLETLLFALVEETFWAGDKKAEGALKSLATAEEFDYERKNVDPYGGKSFLRLLLASNEDWVVPAGSGGRRWFVLEVGEERKEDLAFFKALEEEMQNGGLAAMLYDLQRHDFSKINVRKAPITEWLVEQRTHSSDTRRRWWRDVLASGGFRLEEANEFVKLSDTRVSCIAKEKVFRSAKPHFGTDRRKASPSEVGAFLKKMLSKLPDFGEGPRERDGEERFRTYIFPPLTEMRKAWEELIGEVIADEVESSYAAAQEATSEALDIDDSDVEARNQLTAALVEHGIKDPKRIAAVLDAALAAPATPKSRKNFEVFEGGRPTNEAA
jgi:Family of unknown function (DUF5906)